MFQRIVIFATCAILLLTLTTGVFANDLSNLQAGRVGDRLEELREQREESREINQQKLEEIKQRILQKRNEIAQKVATRQAENRERVVTRIKEVFGNILDRFNAALERLDKIAQRIASRIDKLNEKGVDTGKAEQELTEAETLGLEAENAIASASAQIEAIDTSNSSVKEAVSKSRTALKSAKVALFAYHKGLVEAIRELKASGQLRNATESAQGGLDEK